MSGLAPNFLARFQRLRNFLASWGGSTGLADNLAPLNSALAAGDAELYAGDYIVSAAPTNALGSFLRSAGGRLLMVDPNGGYHQLNSSSDLDSRAWFFGQEYLSAFHKRLISASPVVICCTGDSTTAGTGLSNPTVSRIDNQLVLAASQAGFQKVSAVNTGQSGKSAYEWASGAGGTPGSPFVANDIAAAPNLLIWRWGINDPYNLGFNRTIAQYAADVRAGLTTFRASVPYTSCSIVLMTPNSVSDSGHNRDERWMEQVSKVLRQIAREYQCAFMDTYARFRDSRDPAAADYYDNPYANGSHVHPADCLALSIGSALGELLFPRNLSVAVGYAGNSNEMGASKTRLSADAPSTYPWGITISRATPGNGFLLDGSVMTVRQADTAAFQINFPYAATPDTFAFRSGGGGGNTWQAWQKSIPSPANANWTTAPVLAGTTTAGVQTYSQQAGNYQRAGRRTDVNVSLTVSVKDAATNGNLVINNLPVPLGTGATSPMLPVAYSGWALAGGYTQIYGLVVGSQIQLYKTGPGVAGTVLTSADLANGAQLLVNGSYPSDAP